MERKLDITINHLPTPTWNWLHMNESTLSVPTTYQNTPIHMVVPERIVCYEDSIRTMEQYKTGMGEDMNRLIGENTKILHIETEKGQKIKEPITLYFRGMKENTYHEIEIQAKEDSELTVIMVYNSDGKKDALSQNSSKIEDGKEVLYQGIRTKLSAKENAKIHLIQVQMLGNEFIHLNDIGGVCEERGIIDLLQIGLGSKEAYSGCQIELLGAESEVTTNIGYTAKGKQKFDMNYVINHYGKKSKSYLKANGVLQDQAFKLFRGTIDFKHGSSGSEGEESEDVLLLGDDIVNQTIPLILCAEEDVQGNHGATIGQIDDDVLFYLCSRGMTKEEAEHMLIQARIDTLCSKIPEPSVLQMIQAYREEEMKDGFTE